MARKTVARLALIGAAVTLAAVGWWLLPGGARDVSPDLGDPLLMQWQLHWNLHALSTARLHLFDANMFYPARAVVARTENLFGLTPIFALCKGLGASDALAVNLLLLVSYWASFFGMALLVQAWTERTDAAVLAGMAYAFLPARLWEIGRLQYAQGLATPLAVLAWERVRTVGGWRWGLAFGALLLWQFVTCIYLLFQLAVLLALLTAVEGVLLWRRRERWAGARWSTLLGMLGPLAVLGLLAEPYLHQAQRWGVNSSLAMVGYYSARWSSFGQMPSQSLLWGGLLGVPRVAHWANPPLFCGLCVTLLAAAAVGLRAPRSGRLLLAALLASALALGLHLSFGHWPGPFELCYRFLPGFKAQRVPWRYSFLLGFALCALAGLGLAALTRRIRPSAGRHVAGVALAFAFVEVLCPMPRAALPAVPPIYRRLAALPPAPTLELPMILDAAAYPYPEGFRLYYSTRHWQPLVNGYPTLEPPLADEIRAHVLNGPTVDFAQVCGFVGIRHLVLHLAEMTPGERAEWRAIPPWMHEVARDGPDVLFDCDPPPAASDPIPAAVLDAPPAMPVGATAAVGLELTARAGWYAPRSSDMALRVRWISGGATVTRWTRARMPNLLTAGQRGLARFSVTSPRDPGAWRMEVSGEGIHAAAPVAVTAASPPPAAEIRTTLRIAVERPPRAGGWATFTGRVQNGGSGVLRSGLDFKPGETWMRFRWSGVEVDEPLPIDLYPGQSCPWTLCMRCPVRAGPSRFEISLGPPSGPGTAWSGISIRVGAEGNP